MARTELAPLPTSRARAAERTAQLRDRLIHAAAGFFMKQGFDGTSMGEIATHAGASKETFYRHFPTKEELFRAVVLYRAKQIAEEFGSALLMDAAPEKALAQFGEFVLDRLTEPDAIALRRVLAVEKERFPDLRKVVRAQERPKVMATVCKYLEQQVAHGRLRKLDSRVAARQFFDLVAAEMIMSATFGTLEKPSKGAIRQRVQEAVSCFLHGYGAPTD